MSYIRHRRDAAESPYNAVMQFAATDVAAQSSIYSNALHS
ncbi:protein of unknown function [Burkholderia multivorans]